MLTVKCFLMFLFHIFICITPCKHLTVQRVAKILELHSFGKRGRMSISSAVPHQLSLSALEQ